MDPALISLMDSAWFIIADDFTGSGDSVVQFRTQDFPVRFILAPDLEGFSSVHRAAYVVNSDSRFLSGSEAYARVRDIAEKIHRSGKNRLFKKIDSTLRGNIAEEVAAVMDGTGYTRALVCPAAPRNGRTVVNGICMVNQEPINAGTVPRDHFTPVDEAQLALHFESRFPGCIAHLSLELVRRGPEVLAERVEILSAKGARIFTADAETLADLALLASLTKLPDILFVGSSGLAEALARQSAMRSGKPVAVPMKNREAALMEIPITNISQDASGISEGILRMPKANIAFFVGSVTPTSAAQCAFLAASGAVQRIVIDGIAAAEQPEKEMVRVLAAVKALPDAALLFHTSPVQKGYSTEDARRIGARISQFMGELALEIGKRFSMHFLFVMGGDTAERIVSCLGVDYIDFTDEILPGLPYGNCVSKALGTSLQFACKSGGFGAMDALVRVLERVSALWSPDVPMKNGESPGSTKEKII
jgi:uncharacterized protein YgbK (DUF1537 family)